MKKFELRDFEVRDWISTLSRAETQLENDLLELVEYLEGPRDVVQHVGVEVSKLRQIP